MQEPAIKELAATPLVGIHVETSLSENVAPSLWKEFKQRIRESIHQSNPSFYSVQQFDSIDFRQFNHDTRFIKWAAIEAKALRSLPPDMPTITLEGLYAVFIHRGLHSTFSQTTQYIFGQWLPNSGFALAARPHFEVMDERYLGPMNPDSLEEIWIPIDKIQN